jgi:hypothetical protein
MPAKMSNFDAQVQKLKASLLDEITLIDGMLPEDRTPDVCAFRNVLVRGWVIHKIQHLSGQGINSPDPSTISFDALKLMGETQNDGVIKAAVIKASQPDSFMVRAGADVKFMKFTEAGLKAVSDILGDPQHYYMFERTLPGTGITTLDLVASLYTFRTLPVSIARVVGMTFSGIFPTITFIEVPTHPDFVILKGPNQAWTLLICVIPNRGMLTRDEMNAHLVSMFPWLTGRRNVNGEVVDVNFALTVYPSADESTEITYADDNRLFGMSAFSLVRFLNGLSNEIHPDRRNDIASIFLEAFDQEARSFNYLPKHALSRLTARLK